MKMQNVTLWTMILFLPLAWPVGKAAGQKDGGGAITPPAAKPPLETRGEKQAPRGDAPEMSLQAHLEGYGEHEKAGLPLFTKAKNGTVVGWFGQFNSPQVNIDGSVRVWIKEGDLTIGFSIFNATAPNSVKFCLEENYLPHVITEFERDGCVVQIRHFVDKLTIDGKDFAALYSRVAVRNNSEDRG